MSNGLTEYWAEWADDEGIDALPYANVDIDIDDSDILDDIDLSIVYFGILDY